eukprot:gb/GFBE01008116.1/.p1 GENE.gb/GFBE01008116.1/~~gb/GFBE01008116.1/.p1  ORF type:complete len:442 (+),score=87.80 gb/GFBE01008116.1/:1-1326(+)
MAQRQDSLQLELTASTHDDNSRPRQCRCLLSLLTALAAAVITAVSIHMFGDGADGPGPTPSPQAYRCESNLLLGPVAKPLQKGLAIDDTTFEGCVSKIPRLWPNTQETLASFRLFKAWDKNWPESFRAEAWLRFQQVVQANNVKVLVGTQITCDEDDDDRDWRLVKELLQKLGREHVMGVAFGNEIELLQYKETTSAACTKRMWKGGYFYRKLLERAADLDVLEGFDDVPLTTVFGGYILSGSPFVEQPGAMCNTFLHDAFSKFGRRWIFTLNVYPYFDPANALDPGSSDKCTEALTNGVCFNHGCNLPATVIAMRKSMKALTGNDDDVLWLGETGWSTPQSKSLDSQMAACPKFSSEEAFRSYYHNFLHWDLSIGGGVRGPDHVFYFTTRDASNFGVGEHFGLIESCESSLCKLQAHRHHNGTAETELRSEAGETSVHQS